MIANSRRSRVDLFTDASWTTAPDGNGAGQWRFAIRRRDKQLQLEASDIEPGWSLERLHLLAVVLGLEALDHDTDVRIVTGDQNLVHAARFGLAEWRANNWMWERFGQLVPVTDHDLWQRLDRASHFHDISWRYLARVIDEPDTAVESTTLAPASDAADSDHATQLQPANGVFARAKRFASRLARVASAIAPV